MRDHFLQGDELSENGRKDYADMQEVDEEEKPSDTAGVHSVAGIMIAFSLLGALGISVPSYAGPSKAPDQAGEQVVIDPSSSLPLSGRTPQGSARIDWKYGTEEEYRDFPSVVITTTRRVPVRSSKGKVRYTARRTQEDISPYILKYARMYGLNPFVVKAVMEIESSYDPKAHSSMGACGLMQVLPGTARMMGIRNYWDPEQNIAAGTKYLSSLLDEFGSLSTALAAYNAGPNNIRDGVNYSRKSYYRKFEKAWAHVNESND